MYDRHKFTILLVVILGMMVLQGTVNLESAFAPLYVGALAVIFLSAIVALYQRRETRVAGLALGIPTFTGVLVGHLLTGLSPLLANVCLHLLPILFITYTAIVILKIIFRNPAVTMDGLCGGFCGYILVGVAFGHLYCLVEWLRPGSFAVGGQAVTLSAAEPGTHSLLTYFSLVTLTTVGYGDVTPASPPARSLAAVEAVVGQFYVAVVVAALVALKASAPTQPPPSDRPPGT